MKKAASENKNPKNTNKKERIERVKKRVTQT